MISPAPYSKDYEITDAMFGAFRSAGGAKLFWLLTAYLTIALSIVFLLTVPPTVSAYGRFIVASMEGATDIIISEAIKATIWALLMTVLSLAANAVVRAAYYRAYFFGVDDGVFPIRFGPDEGRQIMAILGFYGLVYILAISVGILIGVFLGDTSAGFATFMAFLLMIVLMGLIYWIMVILSPAGALTALRGRTHIMASRHVSKGRRWAIFGSVLVAGLIGYVAYYITSTIGFMAGLSGLMSSELFSALMAEDTVQMIDLFQDAMSQSGFKAGVALAIILMSAGIAFYYMMIAGPQAFFTRQWAESSGMDLKD